MRHLTYFFSTLLVVLAFAFIDIPAATAQDDIDFDDEVEEFGRPYNTAIGLRFGWGISLSGKHFINEEAAIEATLNWRSFGGFGFDYNWIRIGGLYLIHKSLEEEVLDNLYWYYGGGGYLGFYGGDYADFIRLSDDDNDDVFIGISGALGLDYKLEGLPLNISVDWVPSINIIGGGGFTAEVGGVGVRYTF